MPVVKDSLLIAGSMDFIVWSSLRLGETFSESWLVVMSLRAMIEEASELMASYLRSLSSCLSLSI
jgi:hypothetical protein